MPNITIVVPEDTAQIRVDKFLSGQDEILAACGCANRSHLQNIITNLIINGKPGKFSSKIKAGDKIASIGSTGMSTGPHLHLEVIKDGIKVDPELYL